MNNNQMKGDLQLVAVVALGTAFFSRTTLWGLLAWALSAPFHETGHAVAAWLVSRPAIPSPFKAIVFANERTLWFFLAQLGGCWLLYRHGRGEESRLLVGLAWVWAVLLVFCSFLLGPDAQTQLISWSGLGGELVLTAAAISLALAYGSDLPWVYGEGKFARQHRVLLFWGAIVFSAAATRWFLAVRNPNLIPFGGFGSEEGDLDVLKIDYYWTRAGIVRSYVATALLSVLAIGLVAMFNWEGRARSRD